MVNGVKNGPFIMYWENGVVKSNGRYNNGVVEGICQTWSYEGRLTGYLNFTKGNLNGRCEFIDSETGRRSAYFYVHGERMWKCTN